MFSQGIIVISWDLNTTAMLSYETKTLKFDFHLLF